MELSLALSPCPNDTFIFEGIINHLIPTNPYVFTAYFGDIEELNQKAFDITYNVTKLSYHAYTNCSQHYDLLTAGSALGRNCGPLLISKRALKKEDIRHLRIAIPGQWTTANFLLQFYEQDLPNTIVYLFSDIEQAISNGEVDAGVIIHENRFTYHERGFHLIQDLGQYWEEKTMNPIPLGGIVIQSDLDHNIKVDVNRLIQKSINYAWKKEGLISSFIKQYASEMDEMVMEKHIRLYVNDFSKQLGIEGKNAVRLLFQSLNKETPKFIS